MLLYLFILGDETAHLAGRFWKTTTGYRSRFKNISLTFFSQTKIWLIWESVVIACVQWVQALYSLIIWI